MAKMRKVLAVTMAAAMTMSMLAGCGDKKTDGTEEQTVQSTETESGDVSTETEETETSEAVTEEENSQVTDGDVLVDLNFDDNDTDGCATYFNGGQAELLS